MTRSRRAPAGKRAEVIRQAFLEYHAGRIGLAAMLRAIVTFRPHR